MWLTLVTEKGGAAKNPFDFSSKSSSHIHKEEEQPPASLRPSDLVLKKSVNISRLDNT